MSELSKTLEFDIVICGAGPAGTTCALTLGQSGLKVALLEKSSFPRDKVCGDALAAYVPMVLNSIKPEYAEAFACFDERMIVDSVRFVAPNEKHIDIKFPKQGSISTRLRFDNFLFGLVKTLPNIRIFENTAVHNITPETDHIVIDAGKELRLKTKLLIGCDGAQGIASRKLTNTTVNRKHYSAAVRGYYENVKGIPPSTFEIHLLPEVLPSYLWIFPLPDNKANVGIGQVSRLLSRTKINLRETLQHAIQEAPTLKDRFKNARLIGDIEGYGLPLGSRKVTMSGHRFMLCGDAASLIDPLTGEGIGQAMVSARNAGRQALLCFQENNFSSSFMKQYDKGVYDKFWKTHHAHYLGQKIIGNRPWVANTAINMALKNTLLEKTMKKLFL
jgi:geranylgeranyl reductase family protein